MWPYDPPDHDMSRFKGLRGQFWSDCAAYHGYLTTTPEHDGLARQQDKLACIVAARMQQRVGLSWVEGYQAWLDYISVSTPVPAQFVHMWEW